MLRRRSPDDMPSANLPTQQALPVRLAVYWPT
jgi:hypothetical protein